MFYMRACLTRRHVLLEDILQENMSYRRKYLTGNMFYGRTCAGHVLQGVIFYGRTYLKRGGHISQENMTFGRSYYVGTTSSGMCESAWNILVYVMEFCSDSAHCGAWSVVVYTEYCI